MSLHTGQRKFQLPLIVEPTTVALLPTPYPDGAICPVTDDPENPVYVRKAGAWIPLGGGSSGGGSLVTFEALTFPVDYSDVTAADPPAGTIFTRQVEINTFLTGAGTTNFKRLQAAWDSIPEFVAHAVAINLATGDHPATSFRGSYAHSLTGKIPIQSGGITIKGVASSVWTPIDPSLASLTIDSFDVGNPPNCDPYIDCSTSHPGVFTGFDLRGAFVVSNTGQVNIVGWHTNDRLFLLSAISPAPASITKIAWPSTRLTNPSYAGKAVVGIQMPSLSAPAPTVTPRVFQDLTIATGHTGDIAFWGASESLVTVTRVFFDSRTFDGTGVLINGSSGAPSGIRLTNCSIMGLQTPGSTKNAFFMNQRGGGYLSFIGCYLANFSAPSTIEGGLTFTCANTIFENLCNSDQAASIHVENCMDFEWFDYQYGRDTTIKNSQTAGILIGPYVSSRTYGQGGTIPPVCIRFEGNTGPCILINSETYQNFTYPVARGLIDGGSNLDVGIEFIGVNADFICSEAVVGVSGANGDVRFKDGTLWTYSALSSAGTVVDRYKNAMTRISAF